MGLPFLWPMDIDPSGPSDQARRALFLILFNSHAVEANSLSKEEHAELKRELKRINKPSIKTIKV